MSEIESGNFPRVKTLEKLERMSRLVAFCQTARLGFHYETIWKLTTKLFYAVIVFGRKNQFIIPAVMSGIVGYFFYKFKQYEKISKTEYEKQIQEILRRDDAVVGALRALCSERILQLYIDAKKNNHISPQK